MRFFEFLPLFMPFWVNQYYTNLLIPNLPVYRPGVGIWSVLADPTSEWMLVRRHCPSLCSDSQVNTGLRSHGSVFSRGSDPFMQSLTRQMIEMQLQGKKAQEALMEVINKEDKTALGQWCRPRLLQNSNKKTGPSDETRILLHQEKRLWEILTPEIFHSDLHMTFIPTIVPSFFSWQFLHELSVHT